MVSASNEYNFFNENGRVNANIQFVSKICKYIYNDKWLPLKVHDQCQFRSEIVHGSNARLSFPKSDNNRLTDKYDK
jgi:hypothetical protein